MALTRKQRSAPLQRPRRILPAMQQLIALEGYARNGSLKAIAEEEGVSVPCICLRIQSLEKDIGLVLVERAPEDGRRSRLTEDGERLAEFLGDWLAQLKEALPVGLAPRLPTQRKLRATSRS